MRTEGLGSLFRSQNASVSCLTNKGISFVIGSYNPFCHVNHRCIKCNTAHWMRNGGREGAEREGTFCGFWMSCSLLLCPLMWDYCISLLRPYISTAPSCGLCTKNAIPVSTGSRITEGAIDTGCWWSTSFSNIIVPPDCIYMDCFMLLVFMLLKETKQINQYFHFIAALASGQQLNHSCMFSGNKKMLLFNIMTHVWFLLL